jgi:DNA-directed RNA polymerase specialized sigma24 family protein
MSHPIDRTLVQRALGGDIRGFAALVERHQRALLLYARMMTPDAEAAEQMVVRGFRLVHGALSRLEDLDAFGPFAIRALRRELLSAVGREDHMPAGGEPDSDGAEAIAGLLRGELGPATGAAVVEWLLYPLPEPLRDAWTLRYVMDVPERHVPLAYGQPESVLEERSEEACRILEAAVDRIAGREIESPVRPDWYAVGAVLRAFAVPDALDAEACFRQAVGESLYRPEPSAEPKGKEPDHVARPEASRETARSRRSPTPAPRLSTWLGGAACVLLGMAISAVALAGILATRPAPTHVPFTLVESQAASVALVGDFNGWSPGESLLERSSHGTWQVWIPLAPGTYRYAFLINGQHRRIDPLRLPLEKDEQGQSVSVLRVPNRSLLGVLYAR